MLSARLALPILCSCWLLAACAPVSAVLIGPARQPITASEVKVYLSPPPAFEAIATLSVSSRSVSLLGGERLTEKVIARLREQAAHVGANGLLLEDVSDNQDLSLGTGISTQTYTHNGDVSLGIGGWFGIIRRTGRGRAILVPPG